MSSKVVSGNAMSANAISGRVRFRLGGAGRKAFLITHIVSGALWFGVDIALGILVATALLTDDPATAGTALRALPLFAIWPVFGASVVCLASGVVLGLGSKYGLMRYWWVAVKLAINLLMSTLIVVALRPGLGEAAGIGGQLAAGELGVEKPAGLLFPVVVAPTLLLTAYLLSVWKPRARISWSGRSSAASGRSGAKPAVKRPESGWT